jgi:hypothetical protein
LVDNRASEFFKTAVALIHAFLDVDALIRHTNTSLESEIESAILEGAYRLQSLNNPLKGQLISRSKAEEKRAREAAAEQEFCVTRVRA